MERLQAAASAAEVVLAATAQARAPARPEACRRDAGGEHARWTTAMEQELKDWVRRRGTSWQEAAAAGIAQGVSSEAMRGRWRKIQRFMDSSDEEEPAAKTKKGSGTAA